MDQDTIAAISTPMGEGGIAVIRMSGPESIEVAEYFFSKKLTQVDSHTVHYGYILHPDTRQKIEEVLVTVMRAPRSYTMEDVVEIGCHGGIVSVKNLLDLILESNKVRLAEPGEFTKRAFINGRIDLSQAEAVIDLIRAKSDRAFKVALKQVEGLLSTKIKKLRDLLVELMAHIEVNIDYPEHDVEEMTSAFIKERCTAAMEEINRLLYTAEQGKILREGIMTAIVGRPNVGKSSLLNALARDNKAIVTDIPGTTRDVIEEYVHVNGIPLRLLDTAGIRETSDLVEQIGVERSKSALSEADLILLLFNNNEPLHEDDLVILNDLKNKQTIAIINKQDLDNKLDISTIETFFPKKRIIYTSVLEHKGIDDLERAIAELFFQGNIDSDDFTYVSNARHIHLLKLARSSLQDAYRATEEYIPIDMVQIDVRSAWEHLGEIIGDTVGESLIDEIFSRFCLGK